MTLVNASAAPDYAAIKTRQQATWASGDYAQIGTRLQIVGETLCDALPVRAHHRVLDVAAGNGNASIAAARRYADVTASDYVAGLLERTAQRAAADGLELRKQVADAENLPFENASFDVVMSTFGVMFAPDQPRAAAEMARVTRPGGRIGMANWTPEGFIGELFRVVGRFVPPPAGVAPAANWGTEAKLREWFGPVASDVRVTRKDYAFVFRSAEHFVEVFRTWYGPVLKAFAALDAPKQAEFHAALIEMLDRRNVAGAESLVVPGEYLEVVITKR